LTDVTTDTEWKLKHNSICCLVYTIYQTDETVTSAAVAEIADYTALGILGAKNNI